MSYNFVARTMFAATAAAMLAGAPALVSHPAAAASAPPRAAEVVAGQRGAEVVAGQRGAEVVARQRPVGVVAGQRGGAEVVAGQRAAGVFAGQRGAEVFVQVTPSTVQAGDPVEIQASCDGNDREASVRSDAFGRVSVRPDSGLLTGTATVQERKPPDTYDVVLTCRNQSTANTTLTVVNMSKATRGPATGEGGTAGGTISPLALTGGLGAVAVGAGVALVVRSRRGAGSGG